MIVSICDDNSIGRDVLRELLLEYKKQREISDLTILEYDSPVALGKDLDRVESDVYLLDIFFPDGNGIDLAREIRLRYHHNPIIFITSSQKDTMNAFNVFALRYFVKPVRPKPFFETMDYAVGRLQEDAPKYFMINTTTQFCILFCFQYIQKCFRRFNMLIESVRLNSGFWNIPCLSGKKRVLNSSFGTIVSHTSLRYSPFSCRFCNRYEFHSTPRFHYYT